MSCSEQYTFSELLCQFRARARLSQQALAKKIGVHRNTIVSWEQGCYLPRTRPIVYTLAESLQLSEPETSSFLESCFFPLLVSSQDALDTQETASPLLQTAPPPSPSVLCAIREIQDSPTIPGGGDSAYTEAAHDTLAEVPSGRQAEEMPEGAQATHQGMPHAGKRRVSRRIALGAGATLLLSGGIMEWLRMRSSAQASTPLTVLAPSRTLKGHRKRVESAAWSQDDFLIASVDAESMLHVWEANTGHIVLSQQYEPEDQETHILHTVGWSPDGRFLATGGTDRRVWIRSISPLDPPFFRSYTGHTGTVMAVAWSPDGHYIASGGMDQSMQIWEVQKLARAFEPLTSMGEVMAISWSAQGRYLVFGSADHTAYVVDTLNGQITLQYKGHTDEVSAVAWSPDGAYVASGGLDQTVQVWRAPQGDIVRVFREHQGETNALAWSPDGRYIASGGEDKRIRIWNVRTGQTLITCSRPHTGNGAEISSLAWARQGKQLLGACQDKDLYIWQLVW